MGNSTKLQVLQVSIDIAENNTNSIKVTLNTTHNNTSTSFYRKKLMITPYILVQDGIFYRKWCQKIKIIRKD